VPAVVLSFPALVLLAKLPMKMAVRHRCVFAAKESPLFSFGDANQRKLDFS
jgi:hypothetical protein